MAANSSLFEIKSTTLDLLTLYLHTTDLTALEHALHTRMNGRTQQFTCEPTVIDLCTASIDHLDMSQLRELLAQYGLNAISVRHPNPNCAPHITAAGMNWIEPGLPPINPRPTHHADPFPHSTNPNDDPPTADTQHAPPEPPPTPEPDALFIHKPVRTGQQIYSRGDLVVLAMVSPGAELIADGCIHIYAPLRGRAFAGAHGNTRARIFTQSLEAELVSIAGFYRTFESPTQFGIGQRTQIYLENNKIVLSPIP